MSTYRLKVTLQKRLNESWTQLVSSIQKISSDCQVRPELASEVFIIETIEGKAIKVTINPVVFRLKEKANSERAELLVSVNGALNFAVDHEADDAMACHFKTEVGYFKIQGKGKDLDHIMGLHYDFDDQEPLHPVYHAQLTSNAHHVDDINAHYKQTYQLPTDRDHMLRVARRVRMPTAHMDPLAVFIQLLADHLLNKNSGQVELDAFAKARDAAMFFRSDMRQAQRMKHVVDNECFRGPRWY